MSMPTKGRGRSVGGVRTLPFIVVAAKSLASDVESDVDSIECVIVHASACEG